MHIACPPPIQSIIDCHLSNILSSFQQHRNSVESICILRDATYENGQIPDYSNVLIREYYLLRYFYAYFAEYYYLYSIAFKKLGLNFEKPISIASVGCGAGIDFFALRAVMPYGFRYNGFDIINWDFPKDDNASFSLQNISDIRLHDINVLMFPKSLSEFSQEEFDSFFNNFDPHSLRYPFCIVSSMMDKGGEYDVERTKRLERKICDTGYISQTVFPNQKDTTETFGPNENACYDLISASCPQDVVDYLLKIKESCVPTSRCIDCHIDRMPILTTDYVRFQILYFTEA